VITSLKKNFDWVICDSPAGIERGPTMAMRHADIAIVVTNPEVSSVRDSDRIIGLLDAKTVKAERRACRKAPAPHPLRPGPRRSRRHAAGRRRAGDPVDPAARHYPESMDVLRASNLGTPVTLADKHSETAQAYFEAARRLTGEAVPITIPTDRRGFFGKFFGRKAA
jgi:septum site-determining protein MinD